MVLSWKPIIFHALCKRLDFIFFFLSFFKKRSLFIIKEVTKLMKLKHVAIFLVILCCLMGAASATEDTSADVVDASADDACCCKCCFPR